MWIRQVKVVAGGKEFVNWGDDRIEIDFDIKFSKEKEPDISEVYLYNLSDNSIESIKSLGKIIVSAGYKNLRNMGNILNGDIEEVKTEWKGLDKLTTITVGDGAKSWRNIEVNKTYQAGVKASYIMRDLANLMGYEIIAIEPVEDITYFRGRTINGKASTVLKQLVKDTKSKMFINKNRLVIRSESKGVSIGFHLNFESGLIGTPTEEIVEDKDKKQIRWNVTSLLNPLFETDSIIEIDSRAVKGRFRVIEGNHRGNFNTELVVVEV